MKETKIGESKQRTKKLGKADRTGVCGLVHVVLGGKTLFQFYSGWRQNLLEKKLGGSSLSIINGTIRSRQKNLAIHHLKH